MRRGFRGRSAAPRVCQAGVWIGPAGEGRSREDENTLGHVTKFVLGLVYIDPDLPNKVLDVVLIKDCILIDLTPGYYIHRENAKGAPRPTRRIPRSEELNLLELKGT